MRRRAGDLLALGLYSLFACAANWPSWPGNPQLFREGDQTSMVTAIGFMSFAVTHGLNPLFSNYLNYPVGVNYAQNVQAPLLAFLLTPLTMLAGPIAGLNLLDWAGFSLSAGALYLVLRRLGVSRLGSFVAGLLYGFSPYMTGQAGPHTLLYFVPFPPVVALILIEMLCLRKGRPVAQGALLGVLIAAQFLIQPEIELTTLTVFAIGLVVLALRFPQPAKVALHRASRGLLVAGIVTVAGVAYPLWGTVKGPYHYTGTAQGINPASPGGGLPADLLGTVVPNVMEAFTPAPITSFGDRLVSGDGSENGSYLGIPLILLAAGVLVVNRRNRWIQFCASLAAISWVLSLGGEVVIDNHATFIRLPISLVALLPGFSSIESVRFSLYTDFFLAAMLALGWDQWRFRRRARSVSTAGSTARRWRCSRTEGGALLLAVASIVFLIPKWPYPEGPAGTPAFFTSKAIRTIPQGSVALMIPYPSVATLPPEVWQAQADFRFRTPGGYMYVRDATGGADLFPAVLRPEGFFAWLWLLNGTGYPGMAAPDKVGPHLITDARHFFVNNHIDELIWPGYSTSPGSPAEVFDAALGEKPRVFQGTAVWYRVRQHAEALSS